MSFIKKVINKINENYSLDNIESTSGKVCSKTARLDFQDYLRENRPDLYTENDFVETNENTKKAEEVMENNIIKNQDEIKSYEKYNELKSEVENVTKVVSDLKEVLEDNLIKTATRDTYTDKSNVLEHQQNYTYREPVVERRGSNAGAIILVFAIVAGIIAYGYNSGLIYFDFTRAWSKISDLAVSGNNVEDTSYESTQDNSSIEESSNEHYGYSEQGSYDEYKNYEEKQVYSDDNNQVATQGVKVTNAYYQVYDGYTEFIIETGGPVEYEHKMANYGEGDVVFVDIKNAPLEINNGVTIKENINSNGLLMFKVGKHDTTTRASVSIASQRDYEVIYDEELKAVVLRIENSEY